jgi:hypothetical protein
MIPKDWRSLPLLHFCLSSLLHRSCKCLALCGVMEKFDCRHANNWILGLGFENVLHFDLVRICLAHVGMAFSSA